MKTIGMKITAVVVGLMLLVGVVVGTATGSLANGIPAYSADNFTYLQHKIMLELPECTDANNNSSSTEPDAKLDGLYQQLKQVSAGLENNAMQPEIASERITVLARCYDQTLRHTITKFARYEDRNKMNQRNQMQQHRKEKLALNGIIYDADKKIEKFQRRNSTAKRQVNRLCKTKTLKRAPKSTKRLCMQLKKTVR